MIWFNKSPYLLYDRNNNNAACSRLWNHTDSGSSVMVDFRFGSLCTTTETRRSFMCNTNVNIRVHFLSQYIDSVDKDSARNQQL
jgi:hypothetical protein